jgi:hypothetical protein
VDIYKQKPTIASGLVEFQSPGNDLSSQDLSVQVFSALEHFTSEFGMGSGSSTPLQLPGISNQILNYLCLTTSISRDPQDFKFKKS